MQTILIKVDSGDKGIENLLEYLKNYIASNSRFEAIIRGEATYKEAYNLDVWDLTFLQDFYVEPNVSFYINLIMSNTTDSGNQSNTDFEYKYVPFDDNFLKLNTQKAADQDGQAKTIISFENAIPIIHILDQLIVNDNMPRRLNFIDSSIWHSVIKINRLRTDKKQLDDYAAEFKTLVKRIADNKELYSLVIAQESADLNRRIYNETQLNAPECYKESGKKSNHAMSVVPFLFHSESEMARKNKILAANIKSRYFKEDRLKWRVLLVDDHAKGDMSTTLDNVKITKSDIISRRLDEIAALFDSKYNKDDIFDFGVANNVALSVVNDMDSVMSAINHIKSRRYDIIILDYLLAEGDGDWSSKALEKAPCKTISIWDLYKKKSHIDDSGSNRIDFTMCTNNTFKVYREYGYMFLSYIYNLLGSGADDLLSKHPELKMYQDELRQAKGICGKFWFMFSSGFASAVQDRLLTEGYSHSNKNWYIGRTACPTTTPELFKYNLLSMMKNQLDYITNVGIEYSSDNEGGVLNLTSLIYKIFKAEAEDISDEERFKFNVRKDAIDNFNNLLMMKARYALLKKDYEYNGEVNGSPLVQSLFPDIKIYTDAFWEHIQHLIYLVAYGTIRQWPEMWEEYIFVREELKKAESILLDTNIKPSAMIERYIIKLKNA